MKCEAKTEQEMREHVAPTPAALDELTAYVESLVEREHNYGTCCYAMSLAATAAFNYVASRVGVTGFQASYADLDILRRTRMINGPFMILKAEDALYPQYDLHGRLDEALQDWREWLKTQAAKLLKEKDSIAHSDVVAHWKKIANP